MGEENVWKLNCKRSDTAESLVSLICLLYIASCELRATSGTTRRFQCDAPWRDFSVKLSAHWGDAPVTFGRCFAFTSSCAPAVQAITGDFLPCHVSAQSKHWRSMIPRVDAKFDIRELRVGYFVFLCIKSGCNVKFSRVWTRFGWRERNFWFLGPNLDS